jgi:AcrR family transcriptional regulator
MARPRKFDESEALDRALEVFWRRGFDGCSIDDLIEATGIKRQGLYNAFGDKEAMFLAALRQYRQLLQASLAPLYRDGAGLDDIEAYITSVLAAQRAGRFGACLLVKTAFSSNRTGDPKVRAAVRDGAGDVRRAFERVIAAAIAGGELPASTAPELYAGYLYAVLNGLSALAATGAGEAAVKETLGLALRPRGLGPRR